MPEPRVTIEVTIEDVATISQSITLEELAAFIISPAELAVDDGEASWTFQEREGGIARLNAIQGWINEVNVVLTDALATPEKEST